VNQRSTRRSIERAVLGALLGALLAVFLAWMLTRTTQLQVGGVVFLLFVGAAIGAFLGSGAIRYWPDVVRFLHGGDNPDGSPFGNAAGSQFQLCGECQATRRPDTEFCWLCGAALEPMIVADATQPSVGSEHRAVFQFSLASMMLIVTLCSVLLGVFRIAFGLGIVLAILVTPALVRTCMIAARSRAGGRPMSVGRKVSFFAGTLGLLAVIAVAVPAAFVATCFPIGLAGALGTGLQFLLILAWPVGIAAGGLVLYVLFRLFRRLWPREG